MTRDVKTLKEQAQTALQIPHERFSTGTSRQRQLSVGRHDQSVALLTHRHIRTTNFDLISAGSQIN